MSRITYRMTNYWPSRPHSMLHKAAFFRAMAIPACMVWGIVEFFALQRARLQRRRAHF